VLDIHASRFAMFVVAVKEALLLLFREAWLLAWCNTQRYLV
jgi:hypothetical protein